MTSAKKFNAVAVSATPDQLIVSILEHVDAASAETAAPRLRRSHIRQALLLNNQLITALDEHVSEEASQFWRTMAFDIKKWDADADADMRRIARPGPELLRHAQEDIVRQLDEVRSLAKEIKDGNPRYQRPGEKEEYAWMTAGRISNKLAIAEIRTRQIIYGVSGKKPARSPRI
ncbi:MAG: hypothetical protein ACAH83_18915 [Alphaproteobacteria bacterium]